MDSDILLQDCFPQWSHRNFLSSLSVLILNMEELFRVDNTDTLGLINNSNNCIFNYLVLNYKTN